MIGAGSGVKQLAVTAAGSQYPLHRVSAAQRTRDRGHTYTGQQCTPDSPAVVHQSASDVAAVYDDGHRPGEKKAEVPGVKLRGKQEWEGKPSSRWKLVMYHVLRHPEGGVNVVVRGPRLDSVIVSVNVAEEETSQVVERVVVITAADMLGEVLLVQRKRRRMSVNKKRMVVMVVQGVIEGYEGKRRREEERIPLTNTYRHVLSLASLGA